MAPGMLGVGAPGGGVLDEFHRYAGFDVPPLMTPDVVLKLLVMTVGLRLACSSRP